MEKECPCKAEKLCEEAAREYERSGIIRYRTCEECIAENRDAESERKSM